MINSEKIGPFLRKIDHLWSKDNTKNFCDVWKEICGGEFKYITDEELEQLLKDVHIDNKSIKKLINNQA